MVNSVARATRHQPARRRGGRVVAVTASLAVAVLAAACGGRGAAPDSAAAGDIPDSQAFVVYGPAGGGFSVKVPEGWARTEAVGAVTFSDKFNSIRIETSTTAAAPTPESARHDEVPLLQRVGAAFQLTNIKSVNRSGGPAVLMTYQADAPADPVTGKATRLDVERYEFWKDGHQVVLTLAGAVGSDNVDPWRTVSDSFRWV
jgi:hypothetical protein